MGELVPRWPTPAQVVNEPALGTPAEDGQVLYSTTDGQRGWKTVTAAPALLDPVFSNPESVLAGDPTPLATVDPVFWNPDGVLNA